MTYKEIEQEAREWFGQQPMGSAVRQNGPAAMEGFMAGYNKATSDLLRAWNDVAMITTAKSLSPKSKKNNIDAV